jgi:predicted MPP superfamily phosphohydrolase
MSFDIIAAFVLAAFVTLAAALLAHMIFVAPTRLRLTEIEAPIAGLPAALDGYTLVVLSDMHYGGTLAPAQLIQRAVRLAQKADPDLIVLLGDYAMSHRVLHALSRRLYEWALPELAPALASLRARDGVLAVLGNHDHEYDPMPSPGG